MRWYLNSPNWLPPRCDWWLYVGQTVPNWIKFHHWQWWKIATRRHVYGHTNFANCNKLHSTSGQFLRVVYRTCKEKLLTARMICHNIRSPRRQASGKVKRFGMHFESVPCTFILPIVFLGFDAAPSVTSSDARFVMSSSSDRSRTSCKLNETCKNMNLHSYIIMFVL